MDKITKGYKVFTPEFTSKEGKMGIFEVGKTYTHPRLPVICSEGLHFCLKAGDCFSYYDFDPKNIVCEVEATGDIVTHEEDSKCATNALKIVRRLEWSEVLFVANEGANNTGHSNSGNWNSGDSNSGYWNSGNWNSGNRNSGNWNSGYRNSGNWNSGNRNSGDSNSGYRNSGYRNSGNWNSGNWNSGDRNSGNWNSGYRNSGNWNSGYRNSGNWNSGNWNSGDRNSGDSNSGYRNSGAFCLDNNPYLVLFDKPTKIRVQDWEQSKAVRIMNEHLNQSIWVPMDMMSDEEKAKYPKYETTEGYLKTISLKDAWSNMWNNLGDENKQVFLDLENFDSDAFFQITGIKTN